MAILPLAACTTPGDIEVYEGIFADDDTRAVLYRHIHFESEGYCTVAGCADGTRRFGEYTLFYVTTVEDGAVAGGKALVELEGAFRGDFFYVRSRGYALLGDFDRLLRVDLDGTIRRVPWPNDVPMLSAVPNRAGTHIAIQSADLVSIIDADTFETTHEIPIVSDAPPSLTWSDDDRLMLYARWDEKVPRDRVFDEVSGVLTEVTVDRCYTQPTSSGRFAIDGRQKLPTDSRELPIFVRSVGLPPCFGSYRH